MIVSNLESFCLRLLLGGALDANLRGRYNEIKPFVDELLTWCEQPGVTPAAQEEIDAGMPVTNDCHLEL